MEPFPKIPPKNTMKWTIWSRRDLTSYMAWQDDSLHAVVHNNKAFPVTWSILRVFSDSWILWCSVTNVYLDFVGLFEKDDTPFFPGRQLIYLEFTWGKESLGGPKRCCRSARNMKLVGFDSDCSGYYCCKIKMPDSCTKLKICPPF